MCNKISKDKTANNYKMSRLLFALPKFYAKTYLYEIYRLNNNVISVLAGILV